jgi:uncharacterized membrane protein YphA (DoxX/SURF4 family)
MRMKHRIGDFALRGGLSLVFLWFGVDKFIRPELWVGWIPAPLFRVLGDRVPWFLSGMGIVETIVGLLLLGTGFWLRAGSWSASALLAGIILGAGLTTAFSSPVLVRDFGLLGAALYLALRE